MATEAYREPEAGPDTRAQTGAGVRSGGEARTGAVASSGKAAEADLLDDLGDEIARLAAHIHAATRRTRTIPPALRRALEVRDRGCRFPGCGLRFTDAHHITHWDDGGETSLENCVLLCRRHHRFVHENGWRVEWWGKTRAVFRNRRGVVYLDERLPPPDLPEAPVQRLMAENRLRGADPGPLDAGARWKRERDIPDGVYWTALEAGLAATAPP